MNIKSALVSRHPIPLSINLFVVGMNLVSVQNQRDMRLALERFAFGFPVVTVTNGDEDFMGTLATSFHSIQKDPFQVVCSLGRHVDEFPAYRQSNHFAVNLLSVGQESLANHFSYRPVEYFDGVDVELGVGNTPMLRGCALRIECKTRYFYEVGGEYICIGNVVHCESTGLPDLLLV